MANCCVLALLLAIAPENIPEIAVPPIASPIVQCATSEKHELVLYYTTYCPYSQRVLKYLKKIHKQLPMKNLANDPQAKDELRRVGGKMQVPCLVVDGTALYESNAIIDWLSKHQDELDAEQ